MRKILTGAAILALSTGLLTGCSGMIEAIEKSANYSDVEKIDYNLYRISGTRPNINQQLQLREFLYQRAQDFCMRNGQGAQLIDGVSGKNPKGEGVKAIVVFRKIRSSTIRPKQMPLAPKPHALLVKRPKKKLRLKPNSLQQTIHLRNSFLTDNQLMCFRTGVSDESPVRFQERPKARGVPQRTAPGIFVRANTKNGPLRTVLLCALQLRGNVKHA